MRLRDICRRIDIGKTPTMYTKTLIYASAFFAAALKNLDPVLQTFHSSSMNNPTPRHLQMNRYSPRKVPLRSLLALFIALFAASCSSPAEPGADMMETPELPSDRQPDAGTDDRNGDVDAGIQEPDAMPGEPDAMPGEPDAMPGEPDAMPGEPDAMPGEPDAMPGEPDAGIPDASPIEPGGEVGSILLPPAIAGVVTIEATLYHDDSAALDLAIEYSPDGGITWFPATLPEMPSLTGLASSPEGIDHAFKWDSLDLGFRNRPGDHGILRLTPSTAAGPGRAGMTTVPEPDNRHEAASRVRFHMAHYDYLDEPAIIESEVYDLVVLDARVVEPEQIADIQDGIDPVDPRDDVIVLCYISIGEDLRTTNLSDEEIASDPRFIGDGNGPRIDPRGPNADGAPLTGIEPLGIPSNGGTGYASWYLDDNSVDNSPDGIGDGFPDRNSLFGGLFVNAGDPNWFYEVEGMLIDGEDGIPGIRELVTPEYGRGYGCDGLFLDTVDTAAPNFYTDSTSLNQSEYEWTAPGFRDFIRRLREAYPDIVILQNRGLFYFQPKLQQFQVTTRSYIDFLLFESYRLNSHSFEEYDAYFYPDNKHNVMPSLMAEANRPDGFRVLSLGYAEGPPEDMDIATLLGESTIGYESLIEDIRQAEDIAGFRHFLTDAAVAFPNTFVMNNSTLIDTTPPLWSSTYNANIQPFPATPDAPDARIGVQMVASGNNQLTVYWDVALDMNKVSYALYLSESPFDFDLDPTLSSATRIVLDPQVVTTYLHGSSPAAYPHKAVVTGLDPSINYYLCLRAFDTAGNEEQNRVTARGMPRMHTQIAVDGLFDDWADVPMRHIDPWDGEPSDGPDWREIAITNDLDNLYIRYQSENSFNIDGSPGSGFSRTLIFIDVDDHNTTGYDHYYIGSEMVVFGNHLFRQTKGEFNAGYIGELEYAPLVTITEAELAIPLDLIKDEYPHASRIRLLFSNDELPDYAPDYGYISYTIQD